MEYTADDLKMLQEQSLQQKIDHSVMVMEQFWRQMDGNIYIAFSGGKDSTVLADIASKSMYCRDVPLIFIDTGLEYPEVKEFIKAKGATILRPELNFKDTLTKYGYPLISKRVAEAIEGAGTVGSERWQQLHGVAVNRKTGKPSDFNCQKWLPLSELPIKISNECCNVMKKRPGNRYARESGRGRMTGTTTEESFTRKAVWLGVGCTAFKDVKYKSSSTPLSPWLEQDVLHYIKYTGIDIAGCYGELVYVDGDGNEMDMTLDPDNTQIKCTGCQRTGCMFCPFGMHLEKGETRYQRMKRLYPKQYEFSIGGGEWAKDEKTGKEIWQPNNKGLGFGKVFDMVNDIYGKDFYRYE